MTVGKRSNSEKDGSPVGLERHEFRGRCIFDEGNSFFDFAISLMEEMAGVRSKKGILGGDTPIRLLAALGKTLATVPIKRGWIRAAVAKRAWTQVQALLRNSSRLVSARAFL